MCLNTVKVVMISANYHDITRLLLVTIIVSSKKCTISLTHKHTHNVRILYSYSGYCYTVHGDNYQCITMKEELKSYSLEELRYRDIQGITPSLVSNKESVKRHLSLSERQLEILDILLKSSCVRSTVNYLVCKNIICV